jgi:hypothetical protein
MFSFGRASAATARAAMCFTLWALLPFGCHDQRPTIAVSVTPRDELPPIVRVDVNASTSGNHTVSVSVTGSSGASVTWPVLVSLNVSGFPNGEAIIEATAFDDTRTMVARGTSAVTLPASAVIAVELRCQSLVCSSAQADAGTDAASMPDANPDGSFPMNPRCGNGRLDPGETCDVARSPELLGACPTNCDDGIPCTRDERTGDGCTISCAHVEILGAGPTADGCCPAHADHETDTDCPITCANHRVDPGETCDTAILTGPGVCPTVDSCDDGDPCTADRLISEATCSARCVHAQIRVSTTGDNCCPLGADSTTDGDCRPVCGNGILESGERCDTGIASAAGSCPSIADCDDHDPCTVDSLAATGCQLACAHRVIDAPAPGDGCCPAVGLARTVDSDCPAICSNGVLEAGETCDRALPPTDPGGCPSSCPESPFACVRYVMQGQAADCSAACVATPVETCSQIADGCCPKGCASTTDPDCSSTCGNGRLEVGETCDTAITAGAGACPRNCADGIACTDDLLVDADTCNARCVFVATATFRNGDGCCPPGAHAGVDADCPATCGNAVVETPSEICDPGSTPPSCPASCPPPETCAVWTRTVTNDCDVRCTRRPITICTDGDGCCGPGCNAGNDSDCLPRCGNGIVEPTETCDRGITAGHAGACSASCSDSDPCTLDFASGSAEGCSRVCSHVHITACGGGDQCCAPGCAPDTDGDCAAVCGNGQVQERETCDPPSTCPTSCASDGDPCTVDQLIGSSASCNAACAHVPILRCSGMQRDGCCPTECGPISDSDC